MRKLALFSCGFVLLSGFFTAARAACTSPTAAEGALEYFTATKEYRICAHNQWWAMNCTPGDGQQNGLIRHFKFDENTGTTAKNTVTVGLAEGTLTNFPSPAGWLPTGGSVQGALDLAYNGATNTNDYITLGSDWDLDYGSFANRTISVWLYPDSLGGNSNAQIIGKDNGTNNNPTTGWILRLVGTNQIEFRQDYTGGGSVDLVRTSANNSITLGAWNHVVFTWDNTDTAANTHIYVNGAEVSYATTTNGTGTRADDSAQNMIVGNNRAATLSRMFDGKIDDLRIYTRVLSAGEISSLYAKSCKPLATCASPAQMQYDSTPTAYKFCDGSNTVQLGCVPSATDYTTGLVNRWAMDESSGNIADSVGGITGTAINSPTFNTTGGKLSGAAIFSPNDTLDDNAKPHFRLPTSYDMPAQPFSVSVWLKPSDYYDWRTFFGKRDNGGTGRFQFSVNYVNGQVLFSPCASFYYPAPPGKWTHLVFVSTTTNQTLYVNGQLVADYAVGCTLGSCTGSCYANIGDNGEVDSNGGAAGHDGDPYKGYIDDLRVYNVALNASQADQIFRYAGCEKYGSCSATNAINYSTTNNALEWCNGTDWLRIAPKFTAQLTTGLVGHWKLDDAAGTNAVDSSGNGNTGVLTNGPTWSAGKLNGGTTFDNTNDYIKLPDNMTILQNIDAVSMAAWVNLAGTADYNNILDISGGSAGNLTRAALWGNNGSSVIKCGGRAADADTEYDVTSPTGIGTSTWAYVSCSVDFTTRSLNLYINGNLVASNVPNFSLAKTSNTVSLKGAIGSATDGSTAYFNGSIDDVRIYNRVLDSDEMKALYYAAGGT